MNIPIKITPDNLKQAVLNIKFTPTVPIEFLYGSVYEVLKNDFKYIPNQVTSTNVGQHGFQRTVDVPIMSTGVFQNGKIRVQIQNNGNLIFNNWDKYLGWDIFSSEIKAVISKMQGLELISSYRSIGFRYISEYVNESLFDKLATEFNFIINGRTSTSKSTVLKTEINEGNRKIIINLADKLERVNGVINAIEQFSLIDIDVITPINIQNLEDLFIEIDNSHRVEKEVFFGLLKEDYINTLHPVYNQE